MGGAKRSPGPALRAVHLPVRYQSAPLGTVVAAWHESIALAVGGKLVDLASSAKSRSVRPPAS